MEEKRASERKKVLKGGRLSFNGGHSVIDCTVRNLSESGARVMVETAIGIPDEVVLAIHDGASHPCRVVRRKINEIGLLFLQE
jgi:hypothetical protein